MNNDVRRLFIIILIFIFGIIALYYLFSDKKEESVSIINNKNSKTLELIEKFQLKYLDKEKLKETKTHDINLIWTLDDIVKSHQLKNKNQTFSGSNWQMVYSNRSHNSGKYYFELIPNYLSTNKFAENTYIGISTKNGEPNKKHGNNNVSSWGISTNQISKYYNNNYITNTINPIIFTIYNYYMKENKNIDMQKYFLLGIINDSCNSVNTGFYYNQYEEIYDLLGNTTDLNILLNKFKEKNKTSLYRNDKINIYDILDSNQEIFKKYLEYIYDCERFEYTKDIFIPIASLLKQGFPIRIGVDIDKGKIHIFDYDDTILYTDDIDKNQEYFITASMLSYLNDITLVQPDLMFMPLPDGYKPW
jgi:hypothetical protein